MSALAGCRWLAWAVLALRCPRLAAGGRHYCRCGSLNGCRSGEGWAGVPVQVSALRWQHRGRGVGFPFSPRGCFSAGGVPSQTPPPAFYTRGLNLWPFGGVDMPVIAACRGVSCPGLPVLLCRTLALSRLALGGVGWLALRGRQGSPASWRLRSWCPAGPRSSACGRPLSAFLQRWCRC